MASRELPCALCVAAVCGGRGEGYKRSSPKLDRDLVQADRGSKTEGKVRNWLSGHR